MTNSEHNDLEKLLKDNLSDKTALVPDLVWDKIEEELYPKKKRRGFFWLFFAGIGLIAGSAAIYFMSTASSHSRPASVASHAQTHQPKEKGRHSSTSSREISIQNTKTTIEKSGKSIQKDNNADRSSEVRGSGASTSASSSLKTRSAIQPAGKTRLGTKTSAGNQDPQKKDEISNNVGNPADLALAGSGKVNAGNETSNDPDQSPENAKNASRSEVPQTDSTQQAPEEKSPLAVNECVEDSVKSTIDPTQPESRWKRFAVSAYGGASLYDIAVFKDYFTSGQLSQRNFASSGFEAGAGFSFQVTRKFGVYSNIAFNRKSTSFQYNLAITESQYFNQVLLGQKLQVDDIKDDGIGNCFLVKDVKADYRIDSWLLSLGTTYEVLQWKKFTLGVDLRFSANLNASMQLNELTVIEVQPYETEKFNSLKVGGGLNIGYRLNESFSLGISPMYSLQFNPDKNSFYKGKGKELLLPLSFRFHF